MNDPAELTRREKDVLHYLVDGYTDRETAEALHISYRTVESHRTNIRDKIAIFKNMARPDVKLRHLVEWYKENELRPEIPVIILRGYDNVDRDSIMMTGVIPNGL